MANAKNNNHTVAEQKINFSNVEMYAKAKDAELQVFRDPNKVSNPMIQAIDKEALKSWIRNVGANEKNLRNTARYLYYRSNIFYRIVNWYASMFNLNCRKVTPTYDLNKEPSAKDVLKSYNGTLDALDTLNLQGNMYEVLVNVFREDVYYGIILKSDNGNAMAYYQLDPDECMIDGKYMVDRTSYCFGFSIDMSKWRNTQKQKIIEYIGSPLKEMWAEYQRDTTKKYIHCPAEYSVCFKFRTDTYNMVIPPFLPLFLQLAGLEDLVDIQAEADALSIYKLIYMPMEVLNGARNADDFAISPDLSLKYLQRMIDQNQIPENVSVGAVPGKELKTIDFEKSVDTDTNSVEISSNQILQTAGGGAVINANNITSTAAFNAWLRAETEFAISPLIPQIDGFCNLQLGLIAKKPCKVRHFECSVYTQDSLAESLLTSCQYSYSNRLAYGTLIGVSEKETLAQIYLETEVLKLQDKMKYPLSSSFTTSNDGYTSEIGQGAPTKDDDELTPEGDASRNN
jgi:hypothetical protein